MSHKNRYILYIHTEKQLMANDSFFIEKYSFLNFNSVAQEMMLSFLKIFNRNDKNNVMFLDPS